MGIAVEVEVEVKVARPRAEVAEFMFDPRNDWAWTTGVESSRPLTPGPLHAGAKVERTVRFLGRRFGYQYEVLAADARSVEMRVEDPFPMQVRYELDEAGGNTVARILARGEGSGFFRLAAPLLTRMVRRNIRRDLANLKRCVEARRATAGE